MNEKERKVTAVAIACELANRLFLKIPVTTGPKTRAEAAKPWRHVLQDEGLPITYDEEKEKFVVMQEVIDNIDALALPDDADGGNGEVPCRGRGAGSLGGDVLAEERATDPAEEAASGPA